MIDTLITIASTVFVLGVLIFIHELGHFLVAKKVGIRVDRFSLGFPPFIIQYTKGDTTYSLGLIPLGGFVKMAGENPDEESKGAPDEYMSKSILQRAAVIIAGPFMNYAFAIFLAIFSIWAFGMPTTDDFSATIGLVTPGSPAAKAGIETGDEIISIDGNSVNSFESMAKLVHPSIDKELTFSWVRGGDTITQAIIPRTEVIPNEDGGKDTLALIGVGRGHTYEPVSFMTALSVGFFEANNWVVRTVDFVWMFASRQVPADSIGGPVFIAQASGQFAKQGIFPLLSFMALLSINLAVLNVLPIPVLDGGQLVFLLIEKVKGSPLTMKARAMTQQVGVVFLLLVIVMVTYNDIMRFFAG